jgi:hypothetical protein
LPDANTPRGRRWHGERGGTLEEDLDETLVKQKLLQKLKRAEAEGGTHEYRWGARARAMLLEQDIIGFIAQVYGDQPQAWLERLGKLPAAEQPQAAH